MIIPIGDDNIHSDRTIVTWALIAINIVIFGYQCFLSDAEMISWLNDFAFHTKRLFVDETFDLSTLTNSLRLSSGQSMPIWVSSITSAFLHADIFHLLGNMLFLWIFGDNVEYAMGHIRFLIFYLLCAVLSSMCYGFVDGGTESFAIGASGAISGVMGAYILFFPKKYVTVKVIFTFVHIYTHEVRAYIIIGSYFAIDIFYGMSELNSDDTTNGGTAFWGHIGGMVAGLIFAYIFKDRSITFDETLPGERKKYLEQPKIDTRKDQDIF